jgi:4-hydroxy-tetrahydrodipicolinate synthase
LLDLCGTIADARADHTDKERRMARHADYVPHGVIPAVILPFTSDLAIDRRNFRRHLVQVAATPGITALTVNAHSTEVASCTLAEQAEVMEIAQDAVGARMPLVHGVYADGSLEAARIAAQAARLGASALLVFPPGPFTMGQRPEMVIEHFRRVADAAGDIPIIAFNYPLAIGQGYTTEMIVRLSETVPTVRAIKDWCNDAKQHEENVRLLQGLSRPVNVLSTHSAWLLSSLVAGAKGLLSGSGSVIADLQAELFAAVQRKDLASAQRINDRIWPTAQVFYAKPSVDMHNRMKEALVLLGRIDGAAVRPPLMKLEGEEIARIRDALVAAGLLGVEGRRIAAE